MRVFSSEVNDALAAGTVVLVQLILLEFPGGTVALNTSNWNFTVGDVDYKGAYGLGSISLIEDKPGEVQGIRLELAGGASASITLALDEADEVQGTPCTVSTAILHASTYTVLDAVVDWAGRLDTMSISEDGHQAAIGVTAESSAVDLLRGNPLTYSDSSQQAVYPNDRAFEYVVSQADQPVVWPAREYFLK